MALAAAFALFQNESAHAAKGDRLGEGPSAQASLADGDSVLRFPEALEGIWTVDENACADLTAVDAAPSGSAVALYRGLMEVPGLQCQIYRGVPLPGGGQRASVRCVEDTGFESVTTVDVRPVGGIGLQLTIASADSIIYRFCRPIGRALPSK